MVGSELDIYNVYFTYMKKFLGFSEIHRTLNEPDSEAENNTLGGSILQCACGSHKGAEL